MPTKKTPAKKSVKKAATVPAKKDAAKDLQALFEDGLKDVYWAEKALTKALPKMHKNATNASLKEGIAKHLKETEGQVKRLEACFAEIGKKPQAKKCDAMQGILDEGKDLLEETQLGSVRDAAIIAASQKVEHYEIATYGTLAAFAKVLNHKKSLKHLLDTLAEEKACDEVLTGIADTHLNAMAV